jgi:hypothetical protein
VYARGSLCTGRICIPAWIRDTASRGGSSCLRTASILKTHLDGSKHLLTVCQRLEYYLIGRFVQGLSVYVLIWKC